VSSEITFQVSSETAKNFTNFFTKFDDEMDNLGIISYGVSITTLEEVFLKINQEFNINIGSAAVEDRIKDQTGQDLDDANALRASEDNKVVDAVAGETLKESRESINDIASPKAGKDLELSSNDSPERLVGNSTLTETVKALLIKRFHLYKRDRTGLCCEVAVPFLCVLIGCLFNQIDFS
jgi:hypothetical protein